MRHPATVQAAAIHRDLRQRPSRPGHSRNPPHRRRDRVRAAHMDAMRLDHLSYAAGPDGARAAAAELGRLLGSEFVDGGFHPRFGTRNFTLRAGRRTLRRGGRGARPPGGGQGGLRTGRPGPLRRGRWLARLGGRRRGHGRGRDADRSAGDRGSPAPAGRDAAGVAAARRPRAAERPAAAVLRAVAERRRPSTRRSAAAGSTCSRWRSPGRSTGSTTGWAGRRRRCSPTSPIEWVAPRGQPGLIAATFGTPNGVVRI